MAATLLLADDSVTIQRVIELTFADEQVRVVTAGDGQAAIQKINAERPDIVLADVGMPRVDGYGVAAHVKQTPSLRHIPVVLLTGAFEPIDEDLARATGCDGILVKPFEPQVLIARVRELLGGQRSAALWPAELPRVDAGRGKARTAPPPPAPVAAMVPPPVAPRMAVELPVAVPVAPLAPPAVPVVSAEPVAPAASQAHDPFESELDLLDEAFAKLDPTAVPSQLDAESASDFARDLHELRNDRTPAASAVSVGDVIREEAAPDAYGDWDLPRLATPPAAIEVADVDVPVAGPVSESRADAQVPVAASLPVEPSLPSPAPAPPSAPVAPILIAPVIELPPASPVTPAVPVAPMPAPSAPVVAATPVDPVVAAAPRTVTAPPAAVVPPAPMPRPSLATAFSALLAAERAQPVKPLAGAAGLSEAAVEDVVKQVLARMTDETVHKVVLEVAERVIKEEIARIKTNPPTA